MKNIFLIITAAVLSVFLFTACDSGITNNNITYSVASDHEIGEKTKNLIFIFSASIPEDGLFTDEIKLEQDTGKAGITTGKKLEVKNGRYFTLPITVETEGNIKVRIDRSGIESGVKTVRVIMEE